MKTNKDKKVAAEKAALKQRLTDIALGAYGGYEKPDLDGSDGMSGIAFALGMDAFGRFLGGIKNAIDLKQRDWVIEPRSFEHYDGTMDELVDYLYDEGIRA